MFIPYLEQQTLPLDIIRDATSVASYSTRKLKSSATKCMRVRNTIGDELDIGFVGTKFDEVGLTGWLGRNQVPNIPLGVDTSGNGISDGWSTFANVNGTYGIEDGAQKFTQTGGTEYGLYTTSPAKLGLIFTIKVTAKRLTPNAKLKFQIRFTNAGASQDIRDSSDFALTNEWVEYSFTQTSSNRTHADRLAILLRDSVGESALIKDASVTISNQSAVVTKWYDQSGLANDAVQETVASMPRIVNAGVIDESILYRRSNNSFLFNPSPIDLGENVSISAIFKLNEDTNTIQTIVSNGSAATTIGIKLFANTFNTNDGKMILEVANGTTTSTTASPIARVQVGNWYHVVATVSKTTQRAEVFLNNISEAVNESVINNFGSNQAFFFARFPGATTLYSNSYISDVKFFNKILSEAEISRLYTNAKKKYPTLP